MTQMDKPDSGWIEWAGGECPVSKFALTEYRRRDGVISIPRASDRLDWEHIGHPGDIIAYRVVQP